MDRAEAARVLEEMADLLVLAGANPFEIRAHRNGARSLLEWDGDLAAAVADGSLTSIPGIGKGLSKVLRELVEVGRSATHEELRNRFPGLLEVLRVPGLGPQKTKVLHEQLGVDGLDALERVAREGRVRELEGFGVRTEETILRRIERVRSPVPFPPVEASSSPAPPAPASGRLLAGISGYAYPEWRGTFYPPRLAPARFLAHYAERLPTVEINSTFYRFPTDRVLDSWSRRTPEGFQFALKANDRITHDGRLRGVEEVTRQFVQRARRLDRRLGPILYQLPPSLERDDDRLAAFLAVLPGGVRHAVEFRHASWFDAAVVDRLARAGVAFVQSEDDEFETPRRATADFCYVRLRKSAYDATTLAGWRSWIDDQRAAGRDVHVFVKHDEGGTSPMPVLEALGAPGQGVVDQGPTGA